MAEAQVVDERAVRTSSGHQEVRPVIVTELKIAEHSWPIQVTLTRRDHMGFRMLLGREAVRTRVLVNPGRSFLMSPKNSRPAPYLSPPHHDEAQ